MVDKHYGVKIIHNILKKNGFNIAFPSVLLPGSRKKEAIINEIIKNKVRDIITEELDNEGIVNLSVDYTIKLNKRSLLSILFEVCSFFDGEKKIFTAVKSITLDIKKAAVINIEALFPENNYYDYIINKIILERIVNNQTPLLQEFSNFFTADFFYLTKDSLVVYIPLFKDTKYACSYCTPEFIIPLGDIKGILGQKSPALRLLKNRY